MPNTSREIFYTTHWSAVFTAAHAETARARLALAELCQTYWYPLYAYARRRGLGPHDAEDATQGFFARLLELKSLADVSREKGRFRAFLLAAMKNFLAAERVRATAQKRDVRLTISLDTEAGEERYRHEPVEPHSPETLYDREWAVTLLENVLARLGREYEGTGRGPLFHELRGTIALESGQAPYAEVAARLGSSEAALRVAVHRLRQRYRQLLREEIAQTVADESEVASELTYLRRILAR